MVGSVCLDAARSGPQSSHSPLKAPPSFPRPPPRSPPGASLGDGGGWAGAQRHVHPRPPRLRDISEVPSLPRAQGGFPRSHRQSPPAPLGASPGWPGVRLAVQQPLPQRAMLFARWRLPRHLQRARPCERSKFTPLKVTILHCREELCKSKPPKVGASEPSTLSVPAEVTSILLPMQGTLGNMTVSRQW